MTSKKQPETKEAPGAVTPEASKSNQTAMKGNDLMNDITATNASPIVSIVGGLPVTTSEAIALGVGNPHKSVIQLVRQNVSDLEEFGGVAFEMRPFETEGGTQKREVALLNEQHSTLLMTYMRNNDVVRAFKKRLVKEFFEMAKLGNNSDPMLALNDPATMRDLLLGYSEKVLALESTVQEQAPKVAALDRLSTSDGSLCLTDAAKHLQERPKDLMQWLQANTWIYRRAGAGKWLGYQHRIQQGLLEHKVTTVSRSDGSEKICEQVRVTPKGLSRLAEIFQPTMA